MKEVMLKNSYLKFILCMVTHTHTYTHTRRKKQLMGLNVDIVTHLKSTNTHTHTRAGTHRQKPTPFIKYYLSCCSVSGTQYKFSRSSGTPQGIINPLLQFTPGILLNSGKVGQPGMKRP